MNMIIYEPTVTYSRKEIQSVNIDSPEVSVNYIKKNVDFDPTVENFGVIFLNHKNMVLGHKLLFKGGLSSCVVDPKIIFRECLLISTCSSFIVFHNHPSGDPAPSMADNRVTDSIREGSIAIGFNFLDHIIIGEEENDQGGFKKGFYSFREVGVI